MLANRKIFRQLITLCVANVKLLGFRRNNVTFLKFSIEDQSHFLTLIDRHWWRFLEDLYSNVLAIHHFDTWNASLRYQPNIWTFIYQNRLELSLNFNNTVLAVLHENSLHHFYLSLLQYHLPTLVISDGPVYPSKYFRRLFFFCLFCFLIKPKIHGTTSFLDYWWCCTVAIPLATLDQSYVPLKLKVSPVTKFYLT